MLQRAASNAYSWWWASHIRTTESKWLDANLQDVENRVKIMLKLLGEEADSFGKRAEIYYRTRPEVISHVEELYRAYRALVERYDHISKANHTIATACPEEYAFLREGDGEEDDCPKAITPINSHKIDRSTVEEILKRRRQPLSARNKARPAPPPHMSKEEADQQISRLQKDILVLQTDKEFVKSSYEAGIARYWEIENQIADTQEEICQIQDAFDAHASIHDNEARALMTTAALKSCQGTVSRLVHDFKESIRTAAMELEKTKSLRAQLHAINGNPDIPSIEAASTGTSVNTRVIQEIPQLQPAYENIDNFFNNSSESSMEKVAENVDELVDKIINLDLKFPKQSAQIKRLNQENESIKNKLDELQHEMAIRDDPSDFSEQLKLLDDELNIVRALERSIIEEEVSVSTAFSEVFNCMTNVSKAVESIGPQDPYALSEVVNDNGTDRIHGSKNDSEEEVPLENCSMQQVRHEKSINSDSNINPLMDMTMESPVTASFGPMAPLLQKVGSLELTAPFSSDFKKHLEVLCRDLLDPEETSSMPNWWRKEVRELLYDTEDRLDKIILLQGGDFSELIAGVEDAYERRERLKLALTDQTIKPDLGEVHVSCLTPYEPTSHKLAIPISVGSKCIVGVDELMNKLVKQLAFDDHNQKELKVVPILGLPGVGKTTAAGTLYHEHRGKFQCSAFVRVSRTPDIRSLLISILLQIRAPWLWAFPDVHDLIDGIKKHLEGKRYFIILDGLWTASVWDIMSHAFPDGNYGSRIVTTTQINDVALACCRYYPDYIEMSPLNDDQSRRLFFTIAFGSEDRCPSDFKQASAKIIKKCAGLPLAIVNVGSLLGRGSKLSMAKLEYIQDSMPSILRTNHTNTEGMDDFSSDTVVGSEGSLLARGTEIQKWHTGDSFCSTFEGLKQVLMFIYNNFPPHLKTCLLYLSMYPEGYLVRKRDLVRQWVAEGFMNAVGGRSAEEIAGDYFDELVSSRIVQPVETKYGSEVLSCTVHHMVLDLIRDKSKEMNFIITVDHLQSWLALADQVRRLSIQFGGAKGADIPENIEISSLRSLLFSGFFDCAPSVEDYEFLRVLILDVWADGDETGLDLTRLSELPQLRYLKIQCNLIVDLPDEISGLKYLETLEVDARLSAVPSDIGRLEKLLHLHLPSEAILPSRNVIDLLAELSNLQDLRFTCSTSTILSEHLVGNMKHLGSILGKFNNLRSLALHGDHYLKKALQGDGGASSQRICDDGLSSVSPSPALLEKLELRPRICTLSRIPKWIGELSRLAILKVEILDLSIDDIAILEGLTSLTALCLYVPTQNVEWIVFEKGFPALKYFKFASTAPCMSLLEGAMPNVQKFKLAFNANRLKPGYHPEIFGFKHMTRLTEVTVKFGGANADESSKGDVERVLKDAFSNNPSNPIFNAQWVDCIF